MRFIRLSTCILLALSHFAVAEPDTAKDARALLTKANAASAALSAVSYNAKIYAEGQFAGQFPAMSGTVVARKLGVGTLKQIRIEANTVARTTGPEGPKETIEPVKYVNNGTDLMLLEDGKKVFTTGKADMASLQPVNMLYQDKFLTDIAFRDEAQRGTVTLDGAETLQGIECDVVTVKYDTTGMRTARIFLGKKDNLLRRMETAIAIRMQGRQEVTKGMVIFNIEGLDTKPKIDDSHFVLNCPPGYRKESMQINPQPVANAAIGGDAPEWEMQTPEGAKVTLKSLRGKFVVIDFWSTWCGPCKMAMPGMQKLHERFKGKPVVVYGANCWERSANADPMGYIKSKNFTYPQLLKADQAATAYGVTGIPAIFLIGPDGKILHNVRGFDPRAEENLAGIIEEKLNAK